jgi:hypothetical protein
MMGMGSTLVYTPQGSGNVEISLTFFGNTAAGTAGVTVGPRYGTGGAGSAPANGVAVTGTRFGGAIDPGSHTGGTGSGGGSAFAFTDILALTPGTAYWFDVAILTSNVADAASIVNVSANFKELQ